MAEMADAGTDELSGEPADVGDGGHLRLGRARVTSGTNYKACVSAACREM